MGDDVLSPDILRPDDPGYLDFANLEIDADFLPSMQHQITVRQYLGDDGSDLNGDLLVARDGARTVIFGGAVDIEQVGRNDRFGQDRVQRRLIAEQRAGGCGLGGCAGQGGGVCDIVTVVIDIDDDGDNIADLGGAQILEKGP